MKKILVICVLMAASLAAVYSLDRDLFDKVKLGAYKVEDVEKDGYVEGVFDGDLYIFNSHCTLNDKVDGDLFIESSRVVMGPESSVAGTVYLKESTIIYSENEISAGFMEIAGDTVIPSPAPEEDNSAQTDEHEKSKLGKKTGISGFAGEKFIFYLILFLFTALLRYILQGRLEEYISDFKSYLGKYVLMGLLFWILLPLALIIFAITIIGIPVMIFLILFILFSMFVGFIVLSEWVGTKMDTNGKNNFLMGFTAFIVTDFILNLLSIYGGGFFTFALVLFWTFTVLATSGFALRYIKNLFKKKS